MEKLELHKCDRCPKLFFHSNDLRTHDKYHDDYDYNHAVSAYVKIERVDLFDCDNCRQGFLTKSALLIHKIVHIQQSVYNARYQKKINQSYEDTSIAKPYKCPECNYRFVAEETLEAHSIVHQPYPHICHCGVGYYKLQDLNQHKLLVHKPKPLKTENNNSIKNTIKLLKTKVPSKHKISQQVNEQMKIALSKISLPPLDIEIKRNGSKHQCPDCLKWMGSKCAVITHYRSVHRGERPFPCHLCNKSVSQQAALYLHIKKHLGLKHYECQYCDKRFLEINMLIRHERVHTGYKPHVCSFCKKAFSDPSAHKRHERIHTGDKRYRCALCPSAFTDHSALYAHKKRHANLKDYKCDTCSKTFYCRSFLKKHISVVHKHQYDFKCDLCEKKFGTKHNMMSHIQRVHTHPGQTTTCHLCFKKISPFGLKSHIRIVHQKIKEFICDYCYKAFPFKHALVHHMSMHLNGYKFECHDCGHLFSTKQLIAQHIRRIHLSTKCKLCYGSFLRKSDFDNHQLKISEPCDICDKVFFCKGMLDRHLRLVHIGKKFECDYCSKVFNKRQKIINHILLFHSKAKFICDHDQCGQKFALKDMIRQHMQTHHLDTRRCNICDKIFYSLVDLKRHKKTKCSIKKYFCNICKKEVVWQYAKKHAETHAMNRHTFKCPFCNKKFFVKTSLLNHVTRGHGKRKKNRR